MHVLISERLKKEAGTLVRSGRLAYQDGGSREEFEYEVVRRWQQPVERFLTGGLALLPLAPLCQLAADVPLEQALRGVIHQIDQRLTGEAPYARAAQLMTAAFILTGLRAGRPNLSEIFRGVKVMHESSAFELYEEKGRIEECHRLLYRQGWNRFGAPDPAIGEALGAIRDLDRLERMADAVLTARSWQELLATP